MKRLLVLLAACGTPPEHKLPGASITPQLAARPPAAACGTDIRFSEGGRVELTYRYTYDDFGRLARARGAYTEGGDETIEYAWDNLDHMVHVLQTRSDGGRGEVTARYSTLGDMLEYTLLQGRRYTYGGFTEAGQPTRETVDNVAYRLEYDGGRIARVVPEAGGAPTIYTYDDDARTLVVDTDNGAYRGVVVYDERDHEVSETWDGTEAYASEQLYEWAGDRLLTATYREGSELAPHSLTTAQVETYRYDCR
jgi:hypothetical protein